MRRSSVLAPDCPGRAYLSFAYAIYDRNRNGFWTKGKGKDATWSEQACEATLFRAAVLATALDKAHDQVQKLRQDGRSVLIVAVPLAAERSPLASHQSPQKRLRGGLGVPMRKE